MAWQYSSTSRAGQLSIALPDTHLVATSDVVRLVILHGNEQTLDFVGGIDFVITPPNQISWTDLPVQAGDTLVVFNYGGSRAVPGTDLESPTECPNLLERATAWLTAKQKRFNSCEVVYQRGNQFLELRATIGKTEFEIDDGVGIVQRIQSRDFLIPTADLRFDDEPSLPVVGDKIRELNGLVYEVLAPGHEPHFRFSDPFRMLLRIHTKHVR